VYHVSAAKDELPQEWFARADLLARCPQLLCVSSSGAGYDTVDVPACTAAGVAVVNQSGGNAASVAEHTLGLLLGVSRRMVEGDRRLRRETGYSREDVMGHEIQGKTLGVVGIGHTGSRVAALGKAFGMDVIATDPLLSAQEIERRGARAVSFAELLAQADVVSLHCPRDASTLRMMDAEAFARMKKGAIFITTARGGIHDEAALAQALRSGHLAGAGIDVWDQEPPPLDHPLLAMDNVYGTFHTAGVTHEARRNVARIAAEQIAGLLAGERPPRLVNPEVWPAYEKRRAQILR
jgi:D-3-phosphoglycerate dehydrogenase